MEIKLVKDCETFPAELYHCPNSWQDFKIPILGIDSCTNYDELWIFGISKAETKWQIFEGISSIEQLYVCARSLMLYGLVTFEYSESIFLNGIRLATVSIFLSKSVGRYWLIHFCLWAKSRENRIITFRRPVPLIIFSVIVILQPVLFVKKYIFLSSLIKKKRLLGNNNLL